MCGMHHVAFPTAAIVSMLHAMKDGASAEIAMAGKEQKAGPNSAAAYHHPRSDRTGGPTGACHAVVKREHERPLRKASPSGLDIS